VVVDLENEKEEKVVWTLCAHKFLGDVGHVESRFGPFGDSVSVGAI
jgi:hypothetical protein